MGGPTSFHGVSVKCLFMEKAIGTTVMSKNKYLLMQLFISWRPLFKQRREQPEVAALTPCVWAARQDSKIQSTLRLEHIWNAWMSSMMPSFIRPVHRCWHVAIVISFSPLITQVTHRGKPLSYYLLKAEGSAAAQTSTEDTVAHHNTRYAQEEELTGLWKSYLIFFFYFFFSLFYIQFKHFSHERSTSK